jgi:hypothetical protein
MTGLLFRVWHNWLEIASVLSLKVYHRLRGRQNADDKKHVNTPRLPASLGTQFNMVMNIICNNAGKKLLSTQRYTTQF